MCVLAVPACTSGFLVVVLDGLAECGVDDEAHFRLVDSHAERDGGHYDLNLVLTPALLNQRAVICFHLAVVEAGF